MTRTMRLAKLIEKALKAASPTTPQFAKEVGISKAALDTYRRATKGTKKGGRTPNAEGMRLIADALRRQAATLEQYAERLDQEADRSE